jgi:hypothetical protein
VKVERDGHGSMTVRLEGANLTAVRTVSAGETLIIGVDARYSREEIDEFSAMFREHAPGVNVVIVEKAAAIKTIHARTCDHEAHS